MSLKGVLLTGGNGSRLQNLTSVVNKHLIPVNNKFIVDYSIDTLKQMGCQDILVILGGNFYGQITDYLKDGSQYDLNFTYILQPKPTGIAEAINRAQAFVGEDKFAVCLGDNIFEKPIIWDDSAQYNHAQIILANVSELERFGVASIKNNKIVKIEEKPITLDTSIHNFAISGTYLFDYMYFHYYKSLKPSKRGEYEITEILQQYLNSNHLSYSFVDGLWSDAGTFNSISYLNNYFYNK